MVARSGTSPTVIENSPTPATPPLTTSPGASGPTPTGVWVNTRSPGKSATERESMATSAVALLALFALFEPPEVIARFIDKVTGLTGLKPNIDVALVAHHRLPADAAFGLFATARSVGLLAHSLGQMAVAQVIRPRGRYVGVVPEVAHGHRA